MQSTDFLSRSASTFRGILNDLKRNEVVAARELGVSVTLVEEILAGKTLLPSSLVEKAVHIWPVNQRDFFPLHDDAPEGVRIMRRAESAASTRILQRAGRDYYEYRDTAMSRVTSIRPEWIRILNLVEDRDPSNPAVEWNKGHFLYQFTYFIGEVNYYYEWEGQRYCEPMVTGDSVFGLPYAPHSFSTRSPAVPGLILALTFGGRLSGDAQQELGVLPRDASEKISETGNGPGAILGPHLKALAADRSLSAAQLAERSGLSKKRLASLMEAGASPSGAELGALAKAFRVPLRTLWPSSGDTARGVRIVKGSDAAVWNLPEDNPSYRCRELASSVEAPFACGLEIAPLKDLSSNEAFSMELGLHQYGYNLGTVSIVLDWSCDGSDHRETIEPGDSFYMKPFVAHSMRLAHSASKSDDARLLLLRVGGKVAGDAAWEASRLGASGLRRLMNDTSCWYSQSQ